MCPWLLTIVAVGCLGPSSLAQQRLVVPVTSSAEDHRNAVLSPDGLSVAFDGPDKIGVVPYAGGTEVAVAQGRNLGTFVWTPDSRGLYYLDGTEVYFVARGGGLPRLITNLPETGHALWDITADGVDLFGTWLYVRNNGGQAIRETHVIAIATDGMSAPRTLVTSVLTIDGVRLSPDGTKIAYRQYDATPFTPRDFIVANVDGSSPVSLTGGTGLGINPGMPVWRGDNTGVYYGRIDANAGRPVVEQLLIGGTTPIPLTFTTPARNIGPSADGQWLVYEGSWPASQSWTLVLVPADGGGHVFLDTSRPVAFTGAPQVGGPNNDRIVVSGTLATAQFAQVLKVELARELRISPRATVGGSVTLELPISAGESGIVFLGAGALPVSIPVRGLAGGFQLDPTALVTVLAGTGSGQGSLSVTLPIPNVTFLRRKAVHLQGVRLTSAVPTGDFTRFVELPIF